MKCFLSERLIWCVFTLTRSYVHAHSLSLSLARSRHASPYDRVLWPLAILQTVTPIRSHYANHSIRQTRQQTESLFQRNRTCRVKERRWLLVLIALDWRSRCSPATSSLARSFRWPKPIRATKKKINSKIKPETTHHTVIIMKCAVRTVAFGVFRVQC